MPFSYDRFMENMICKIRSAYYALIKGPLSLNNQWNSIPGFPEKDHLVKCNLYRFSYYWIGKEVVILCPDTFFTDFEKENDKIVWRKYIWILLVLMNIPGILDQLQDLIRDYSGNNELALTEESSLYIIRKKKDRR